MDTINTTHGIEELGDVVAAGRRRSHECRRVDTDISQALSKVLQVRIGRAISAQ